MHDKEAPTNGMGCFILITKELIKGSQQTINEAIRVAEAKEDEELVLRLDNKGW